MRLNAALAELLARRRLNETAGLEWHNWAYIFALIFMLFAVGISAVTIKRHLQCHKQPALRVYYIRVCMMVPIYAVEAYIGLTIRHYSLILEFLRDCYEAFVIFSFLQLLLTYLGGPLSLAQEMREISVGTRDTFVAGDGASAAAIEAAAAAATAGDGGGGGGDGGGGGADASSAAPKRIEIPPLQQHMFPFSYVLAPWTSGPQFVRRCLLGAFQYTLLMPVVTAIAIVAWCAPAEVPACTAPGGCPENEALSNYYGNGHWRADRAYMYCAVARNLSQVYAMYCLVMLYRGTRDLLRPISPLAKFVCIKLIVFFTFWQALVVAGLVSIDVIDAAKVEDTITWSSEEIAAGLQDFVICFEMLLFAVAHGRCFGAAELEELRPRGQSVLGGPAGRGEGGEGAGGGGAPGGGSARPPSEVPQRSLLGGFMHGINFFDLMGEFSTLMELKQAYSPSGANGSSSSSSSSSRRTGSLGASLMEEQYEPAADGRLRHTSMDAVQQPPVRVDRVHSSEEGVAALES